MSFPRYPKYKDSGVEWLGDVPEGWEVKRARAVGVFSSSGIDKKSVDGEQAVQMFNYLDVYKSPDKTLRYSEDLMWTTAPVSKVAEHSVLLDDILLTPSSETADDIGHAARVASVPPNILYSYHILRFRKGVGFDASFVTHCFNAVPIRSYFESVCTGTTRKVLVRDDFKNAPFAIPPLPEQTAIAEFLDRETGKIDGLVAEQRRLMELLKEKRQAVISHAVTKGLNPHAPMKPSGIEWLGDVPKHWAVKPLRHLGRCQNGLNIGGEAFGSGSPFVSYGDVYKNTVLPASVQGLVQSTEEDRVNYSVQRGDVFFTRTSETIDEIGMSSTCLETIPDATFAGFLIRFRPVRVLDCRFSKHYFSNPRIRAFFAKEMVLITRASLSQDLLKRLPVLLPPVSEQIAICDYLDKRSAAFDALTAEAQRAIDLLQERRTALISAAVTGQIDVRQPPRN